MTRWLNLSARCLVALGTLLALAPGARADGTAGCSFPVGLPTLLATTHRGILNSPDTWNATLRFRGGRAHVGEAHGEDADGGDRD